MNRLPISVCLISGAEAQRIGRALESVAGWTSEIIVVLNEEVQDGTEEIAVKHGAKVFREAWKGYVAQKNSAVEKAAQPWVLSLDADEEVPPALREELAALLQNGARSESYGAFCFPRRTFCCGRWIRHGDWYPDRVTRLWRKGQAAWAGDVVHERVEVRGETGRLRADLLHYTAESIDRQIAKISRYGNEFVRERMAAGRPAGAMELFVRPAWRFFRCYVLRLGFLDGWQGYYVAWFVAFYTMARYAKLREAAQPAATADGAKAA